jgi:hypothetical protein
MTKFNDYMDQEVERAAERALDSIASLREELIRAAENVSRWRQDEPGLRPEIHHQRIGDAVENVERFAELAITRGMYRTIQKNEGER